MGIIRVRKNHGYKGHSMSKGAARAHQRGEKPESQWTKETMLSRIKRTIESEGLQLSRIQWSNLQRLPQKAMFDNLFETTDTYRTGAAASKTSFYNLNRMALRQLIREGVQFLPDYVILVIHDMELVEFDNAQQMNAYYKKHNYQNEDISLETYAKKMICIK